MTTQPQTSNLQSPTSNLQPPISNLYALSPEALKAQESAAARDLLWRPRLLRTQDRLIFRHAVNANQRTRRAAADKMLALGWTWDSKVCQFHTPLTNEALSAVLDAWTTDSGYLTIHLSTGIRTLLQPDPASQ